MELSRRQVLGAFGAVSATAVLSSCAGFGAPSSGGGGGDNQLTFTTWASETEEAGFKKTVAAFEKAHDGVKIKLNVVPYEQMFSNIDAQLQSNTAPDIFRVDYGTVGVYSSQEQLLDLSSYFDKSAADAFIPALWQAVQFDGTPFGVPHQTDTSAIMYNKTMFEAAGISSVPDTLESAWTWEEFEQIAQQLRGSVGGDLYPFVYNWQLAGASRWLNWLFQAGGRYLEDDLKTPAIDSDAGRKALDFTKAFFTDKLVPENTSVKSASYADEVFIAGTTAMSFVGSFLVPDVDAAAKFEWGATFCPRDERGSGDLGGNALVATAGTKNPDLAAEFLAFMVSEDSMKTFCSETNELPTLTSLVDQDLDYTIRPDVMPVFVQQATTIEPSDVAQLTSPNMAAINTALQDQLELAFVSGQSTDDTLSKLSDAIAQATGA